MFSKIWKLQTFIEAYKLTIITRNITDKNKTKLKPSIIIDNLYRH